MFGHYILNVCSLHSLFTRTCSNIIYSTLHLNFGQTQPIKVYSPRNFSHFTCFGSRIGPSYKIKFGHLNSPRFLLPWGIKLTILPKHGLKNFLQFLHFFFQQFQNNLILENSSVGILKHSLNQKSKFGSNEEIAFTPKFNSIFPKFQ